MASSNTNVNNLGNGGKMYITIQLESQNLVANTSTLKVFGELENTNNFVVDNGSGKYCSLSIQQFFDDTWDSHFKANERRTIISHTFTISHGSDGDLTVHWNFHIGNSGTNTFGGNRDVDATLFCKHIDQTASKPAAPTVAALTATSIDLSWPAPANDHGPSITDYIVSQYNGPVVKQFADATYNGLNRTRHITGLTPGATYTFTVVAINGSQINGGKSPTSNPRVVTLQPGPNIRVAGVWTKSTLYVRDGGEWKQGIPFVRSGGVWKQAI